MVWGQCFEGPQLTKRNVHNGLGTQGSPNRTNTLIWWPIAHQALHIQLCGDALLTKTYKYRGGAGLGNGTGMVGLLGRSRPPLHRRGTIWQHWKTGKHGKHGKRWKPGKPVSPLIKHHKYYGLIVHGSPNAMYTNGFANIAYQNHTNTMVWWPMAHQTLRI